MKATQALQVSLVAPTIWQPLLKTSFRRLKPQEERFADSALMTMHNRHVGVTPQLMAELTPLLLDSSAEPRASGAWGEVFQRLIDELSTVEGRQRQPQQRRFGLLLSSTPIVSVLRLAQPIIEAACRQIGRCYLFCADDLSASVEPASYDEYSEALSHQIIELARNKGDQFQLFWKERAITLSTFSRQPAILAHSKRPLPEVDPTSLGFLFRLDETKESTQQPQSLRRLRTPFKRQRSRSRKEGGIDGIHITRREEDINSILLSEFANHPVVRADHLLNTGYLAIERQPKREKLRDVLIAALMPGEVRAKLSADFVKACWFNCLMRLSFLLRKHRLYQSEFRWIEGDTFDRARSNIFLLQDMPTASAAFENVVSQAYRQEFMTALRWLPRFLNTREQFSPLSFPETAQEERADRLKLWLSSAWRAQKEHLHWQRHHQSRHAHTTSKQLKVDQFAFVHLMLFLPADKRHEMSANALANLLGEMLARLRLGNHPARNLSITWVPDYIEAPDNREQEDENNLWRFAARARPDSPLFRESQAEKDVWQIAEKLEQTWLNQLIQEIQRV